MGYQSGNTGQFALSELREFASFPAHSQRYIRRSLDIALNRRNAIDVWSRNQTEIASIKAQIKLYQKIDALRGIIPSQFSFEIIQSFMSPLIELSTFDIGQGKLGCFSSYRFLYERLLGAKVRQWLPSSFCSVAALPHLHPDMRKELLTSISEAAATARGWSTREPVCFPEWVEKVA